jgi:hypothetical protein
VRHDGYDKTVPAGRALRRSVRTVAPPEGIGSINSLPTWDNGAALIRPATGFRPPGDQHP